MGYIYVCVCVSAFVRFLYACVRVCVRAFVSVFFLSWIIRPFNVRRKFHASTIEWVSMSVRACVCVCIYVLAKEVSRAPLKGDRCSGGGVPC